MKTFKTSYAIVMAIVIFIACSKETQVKNQQLSANEASNAVTTPCDLFAYPDTIYYPQSLSSDYVVKPMNKLTGTFGAFPDGLKINKTNGNIDITESETGLKYIVWFVATGSTDTCKKTLRVSGVNYTDSIYVIGSNTVINASPVYNADSTLAVPCNGCEFDDGHDDDNGNGFADEPPAGEELTIQGVAINKKNGKINLKKTINNGALGKNPSNGTFKDYVLNYRIGDKSSKTLNTISFRLYYYKTKAQVPDSLKNILAVKQGQVLLNDDGPGDDGNHGGHSGNFTNKFANVNLSASQSSPTGKHGAGEVKCRPPYIIVTQN